MSTPNLITREELIDLLSYDPDTGIFVWIKSHSAAFRGIIGSEAGYLHHQGYRHICIKGKTYASHRLAWLILHGAWPKHGVDHINGNRADNRILNLRAATHAENHQNRKSDSGTSSKYVGVSYYKKNNKYIAYIDINYKRHHLGYFETEEEAFAAYCEAKKKYHTFSPTPSAQLASE